MDPKLKCRPRRGPGKRSEPGESPRRGKPRDFEEWKALATWGKLPPWEPRAPGYQLRLARETAGLTQAEMAARLGVTQQAVARAERWDSNPTFRLLEAWAQVVGAGLELEIRPRKEARRP
jgi:DNA-binding XRE family transcriptional regulator